MLLMILKMSVIMLLHVILTLVLWRRLRNREITHVIRIGLGIIYGMCAVLSTHFGVDYGDMMLNVRDIGPMAAGLFFDPVSGIIAGIIGGTERYIAGTHFGVASFTCIACSIATLFSGFFAAFMSIVIFKRKKPSTAYAFFLGAVIEVFHMYIVFITHRDNMEMAFYVVRTCALPMVLFTGAGLALSARLIKEKSGELKRNPFKKTPEREVPLSNRFQVWLFVVAFGVLLLNFVFNYTIQTNIAMQDAKDDLDMAASDIGEVYDLLKSKNRSLTNMIVHVGEKGVFSICDTSGKLIAGNNMGFSTGRYLRAIHREYQDEKGYFVTEYSDEEWLCRQTRLSDDNRLLVMMSFSEIFENRAVQSYETLFTDILIFTVIYILVSMLVQMIVVDNLELINRSLNKITEGKLDEKVHVYSSSEFASLSDDINEMVDSLKGYIAAAEKRMQQELRLAHTIQESALPKEFDFNHKGFEIYATMDPAKEVGGDFYDFFFVEQDRLALVIADVSGKGIPASLFMMRSKTTIRSLAETGHSVAEVLELTNNELCANNEAEMFVTAWMGVINLDTGVIKCVNAGHEYPAVMRAGGLFELVKDAHKPPLGAIEGLMFDEYELKLEPGDCLYVYTDGVPEAINKAEEQYGTDRMLDALNIARNDNMEDMLPDIKADVDAFADGADQFDDITMIGFRYFGPRAKSGSDRKA